MQMAELVSRQMQLLCVQPCRNQDSIYRLRLLLITPLSSISSYTQLVTRAP